MPECAQIPAWPLPGQDPPNTYVEHKLLHGNATPFSALAAAITTHSQVRF